MPLGRNMPVSPKPKARTLGFGFGLVSISSRLKLGDVSHPESLPFWQRIHIGFWRCMP